MLISCLSSINRAVSRRGSDRPEGYVGKLQSDHRVEYNHGYGDHGDNGAGFNQKGGDFSFHGGLLLVVSVDPYLPKDPLASDMSVFYGTVEP